MENNKAIEVKNLYKAFKIPHERRNSFKSVVFNIFKKNNYTTHKAAENISFEVKRGEFLGIIGRNGCGKSTLLKMLAGIYQPDKGEIIIDGAISPFLELGVGFNPDLTAKENIYLNGVILGLSKKEINERFDDIIRFSELEEFVDQKLKNFSSGMQVRLAFSVAIQAHAEIILVDEVLAVGDVNFQTKCFEVFRKLKKEGKTIIFVSHQMSNIEQFCDRVIMLEKGKIVANGSPQDVIFEYEKINSVDSVAGLEGSELGNKKMVITKIEINKGDNKLIQTGEDMIVDIHYKNPNKIKQANFAVGVHSVFEGYMIGVDTKIDNTGALKLKEKGVVTLTLKELPLLDGEYIVNASCFDEIINTPYHFVRNTKQFQILNKGDKRNLRGMIDVSHDWSLR